MMKVVGEEGTSLDDYTTYLKSDLLDSVYLQQNSFDPVDFAAPIERQQIVFDLLFEVLASELSLEDKKEARSFINEMRQAFIDWNNTPQDSERFGQYKDEISSSLKSRFVSFDKKAYEDPSVKPGGLRCRRYIQKLIRYQVTSSV